MSLLLVEPTTVNFLQLFAVCSRTCNFLQLLADRILNFLCLELLAEKHNLTSFCRLRVLAVQELLAPLLACACLLLFSGFKGAVSQGFYCFTSLLH